MAKIHDDVTISWSRVDGVPGMIGLYATNGKIGKTTCVGYIALGREAAEWIGLDKRQAGDLIIGLVLAVVDGWAAPKTGKSPAPEAAQEDEL